MNGAVMLPPSLRAKGYGFEWRDETGSTNADALDAARAGHPAPCWFLAGQQLSGRGRSGRQWVSPPGNLYASLLLRNPCPMAMAAQLGFVAGIALHDAIVQASGMDPTRLKLKWPNDVLLDGKKAVGLLLEAQSMGQEGNVVIGCGINIAHRPRGVEYPVAVLQDVAPNISASGVFSAFALSFEALFSMWRKSEGQAPERRFAPFRALWLERAAGLGGPASVNLASGKVNGIFEGIDRLGRLELMTETGLQTIDAGDLFFAGLSA